MATLDTISERSTTVTLSMLEEREQSLRKTKIVCTMGPKCWSEETLGKLIDNGMNVMRMNFSHGTHEAHLKVLQTFRQAGASIKIQCSNSPSAHLCVNNATTFWEERHLK